MCVMDDDKKPECYCPTECEEEEFDPHCSVFLSDYPSLCEVHRHACSMKINVAINHKGKCKGSTCNTCLLNNVDCRIYKYRGRGMGRAGGTIALPTHPPPPPPTIFLRFSFLQNLSPLPSHFRDPYQNLHPIPRTPRPLK